MNDKTYFNTPITNECVSVRTLRVLQALNINTIGELKLMEALEAIPEIGTTVRFYPFVRSYMIYTTSVDREIRELLSNHK
jgi:hypothetical protein